MDGGAAYIFEKGTSKCCVSSTTIQNEMISKVGDTIRNKIIKVIKHAKYFSILADQVMNCANLEQVSVLIRFLDFEK